MPLAESSGNGDLFRIRDIDEGAPGRRLDLEALGMSLQGNRGDHVARHGIDDRQAAIAITDDHGVVARIDANIIGVLLQVDLAKRLEILGAEDPYRAIAGVGNERDIGFVRVSHALRLFKATNVPTRLAAAKINHFDGIISKGCHDEVLAAAVNRHVIDPPADIR
jgi:hypothetical protein